VPPTRATPATLATRAAGPIPTGTVTALAPPVIGYCDSGRVVGTPSPDAPFNYSVFGEQAAQSFAARVRAAPLILLVARPGYAPARWTTVDGLRPANPHPSTLDGDAPYTIITPERAEVVAVAKGDYALPAVWLAHFGGRIGRDCVSGSPPYFAPDGTGLRFLYLLDEVRYPGVMPVPDDPRYRFYTVTRLYAVAPTGLVTIGPESDIMGNHFDTPPRTTPLHDVLAEIAALAGPAATPTAR